MRRDICNYSKVMTESQLDTFLYTFYGLKPLQTVINTCQVPSFSGKSPEPKSSLLSYNRSQDLLLHDNPLTDYHWCNLHNRHHDNWVAVLRYWCRGSPWPGPRGVRSPLHPQSQIPNSHRILSGFRFRHFIVLDLTAKSRGLHYPRSPRCY